MTFCLTSTGARPTSPPRSWGPTRSTLAGRPTCGGWVWCSTRCLLEGESDQWYSQGWAGHNNPPLQVSISRCWTQWSLCKNKTRPVYSSRKSQFPSKVSDQMSTEERPKRENNDWRCSCPSLAGRLQQRERSPQEVSRGRESRPGSASLEPTTAVTNLGPLLG